jgi:hypothetical protein
MTFSEELYIKHKIEAIKVFNAALTKLVGRTIKLDNFGQKHPNTYTITVGHTITNIVIGWEELLMMRDQEEVEELAEMIKERILESSDKGFFYTIEELSELVANKDPKPLAYFVQLVKEQLMNKFNGQYNDKITRDKIKQYLANVFKTSAICDETNNSPELIDGNGLAVELQIDGTWTATIKL